MRTFRELLQRLEELQGVPFAEVADAHGWPFPDDGRRGKAFAGRLVEDALGLPASSSKKADLQAMGLEIKTVPLDSRRRVRENTKIGLLNPTSVCAEPWERSSTRAKVRSLLFVPIVKADVAEPQQWYVRAPFIWLPSLDDLDRLAADYQQVRDRLLAGRAEDLTASAPPKGFCNVLIPNTGGRDSRDRVTYEVGGSLLTMKRRAWMLRKSFVQELVDENIRYRPS